MVKQSKLKTMSKRRQILELLHKLMEQSFDGWSDHAVMGYTYVLNRIELSIPDCCKTDEELLQFIGGMDTILTTIKENLKQ